MICQRLFQALAGNKAGEIRARLGLTRLPEHLLTMMSDVTYSAIGVTSRQTFDMAARRDKVAAVFSECSIESGALS